MMDEKKIVVLAFPRSGTLWMAKYLQSFGLDFGHECWRKNGGVGYIYANEEYLEQTYAADAVIHLVCNPVDCISSAEANYRHTKNKIRGDGTWEDAWIHWNLKFEEVLFRMWNRGKYVEQLGHPISDTIVSVILSHVFNKPADSFVGTRPPTNIHHRVDYDKKVKLKPGTIDLARRYGFYFDAPTKKETDDGR